MAFPLSFEQRDLRQFLSPSSSGTLVFLPDRLIAGELTMRFVGSSGADRLQGLGPSSPSTHLRAGFSRTFRQYPKLLMHRIYPGIDAVFYGQGNDLEYDLQLAAGASPDQIRIAIEGARSTRIDAKGNLAIESAFRTVKQMRPRVRQRGVEVPVRYVMLGRNQVGIRLGKYDRSEPLTIDPVLSFRSTFGGSQTNTGMAVALDPQGNIFVAGLSNSPDFPTTSKGFEPKPAAPVQVLSNGGNSVTPLRPGLSYVNLIGGSKDGKVLYAAITGGMSVSGDSGATWHSTAPLPVATAVVYAISVDPLDPATLLVGTSAGLFRSASGGQSWAAGNAGLAVSRSGYVRVSSVFYHPTNPLIAYAATVDPGYFYVSSDAGNTWLPLNPSYPGEPAPPTDPFNTVTLALSGDGGTLYSIDGNGNLQQSADGGNSWTRLAQALTNPVSFQIDTNNANTLYVLTRDFGLEKSLDGGLSFAKVTTPFTVRQFGFDGSGALYISNFQSIDVSVDGGATFNPVPLAVSYSVNSLSSVAGKLYAASVAPPVPFVVKLDPSGTTILASTFLGGSQNDYPTGIAVDSRGQPVLVGYTISADFPFTTPRSTAASPQVPVGFVAKLSSDGTHLIYATSLGGSKGSSFVEAVTLDSAGAVYATGVTGSPDFPTTAGAFQMAPPITSCARTSSNLFVDSNTGGFAFVSKIAVDGSSLLYSTFLAGSCGSFGGGIAVDSAGEAYVVGSTTSPDFPVKTGSYQATFPGPLNTPSSPGVLQAGFAAKLSANGTQLLASTFLGGGYSTAGKAVTLDAAGNPYLTGSTQGFAANATPGVFQPNFVDRCTPTINIGPGLPYRGTSDAFVLKMDPALSTVGFLTYLGGSCSDSGVSIALDAVGDIWVSGSTSSPDLPLKDPFQVGGFSSATAPGFAAELSPDASQLLFMSYTEGTTMALNSMGVFLAGTSGELASVSKIDPLNKPAIHVDNVSAVASFPTSLVEPFISGLAPGLLVQITGRDLGPATKVNGQLDAFNRLPTTVANTSVLFDGIPAPIISVQPSSITCLVPFEVGSTTQITVVANGQKSNTVRAGVGVTAPQILSVSNQDGSINSLGNPAKLGSVIVLYVSGLGQTTPLSVDGLVNTAPLSVPNIPVSVFVSSNQGSSITPQAVVSAPGQIAGITQVNVALPSSLPSAPDAKILTVNIGSPVAPVYVTQ